MIPDAVFFQHVEYKSIKTHAFFCKKCDPQDVGGPPYLILGQPKSLLRTDLVKRHMSTHNKSKVIRYSRSDTVRYGLDMGLV